MNLKEFNRVGRMVNHSNLLYICALCKKARDTKKVAVIAAAKTALLSFIGRHTCPAAGNKTLTATDFAYLSEYYQLHLEGISVELIGQQEWTNPETLWNYCVSLHTRDNWASVTENW